MKSTWKMSKIVFGSILALTFVLGTTQAHAQGTWDSSDPTKDPTPLTPMPTARNCLASGVINGELYVAGGCFTSVLEVYDPVTDMWAPKFSDPYSRQAAAGAVANDGVNDKLFVVGGCINTDCTGNVVQPGPPGISGTTNLLEVYDPVADTWDFGLTPMPTIRAALAFEEIGGLLYAVGGISFALVFHSTLEVYDPVADSWSTLAPMPTARGEVAAGVINGELYVVGGQDVTGRLATLEVYDPVADSWSTLTPMPTARNNPAAGVINGKLYVVGGATDIGIVDTVEVYDPGSDTWSTETMMPTARNVLAAEVIAGKLYAVGGGDGFIALDTLEVFTPANLIFGVKSKAVNIDSNIPANLFSFQPDGTGFIDHGPITLGAGGPQIDVDGLAMSPVHGLLGFKLDHPDDTDGETTASTLISINTSTAVATTIGSALAGRDIRGAVFDLSDNLWVIDAAANSVLQVNPTTGAVVAGTEFFPAFGGLLLATSDIAVRQDGTFYLTSLDPSSPFNSKIFTLDIISGALTEIKEDDVAQLAGITFAAGAESDDLFGFDIRIEDDIFRHDVDVGGVPRTLLIFDIIPFPTFFNAGRGDLAALLAQCVAPPSGLISWWDADDVTGTSVFDIQDGNDGTLENGATTAPGKVGDAFSFDGVGDFVEIPDNASLRPATEITVDAWVRVDSVPDNVSVHIIDRHNSESPNPLEGYLVFADGTGFGSLLVTNNAQVVVTGGPSIVGDAQFHHVAMTYDGANVRLYVDGVQVDSEPATGSITYVNTINLNLGRNQPSANLRRFDGLLDEVEIFDRALSAAEIQAIFNAGSAGKCKGLSIDIKPDSCPNPLNVKSKGVLPVAILGTADFDVNLVDPQSVFLENVPPLRAALEDVATPFEPFTGRTDALDCTDEGPDGFEDLTLKFDKQAIVTAIGAFNDGDVVVLTLTGELTDGTPFVGEDVVIIKKKGK